MQNIYGLPNSLSGKKIFCIICTFFWGNVPFFLLPKTQKKGDRSRTVPLGYLGKDYSAVGKEISQAKII